VNAPDGRNNQGEAKMRFMLLQNYAPTEGASEPIGNWPSEDIEAHIAFQRQLNDELTERGELVDAQALAGPELAKFVVHDGVGAPVVTDGPFPESKELLAGYRIVDVQSPERAIEIAAKASAAPAPGGAAIKHYLLTKAARLGGSPRGASRPAAR
jgi:hypothetical protein